MRGQQVTDNGEPARGRWETVRAPVLDGLLAVLVWAGMVVELATRPLTVGQSPTTPAAYIWAAAIAAPIVVHRRYPVIAMLISNVAMVGYSLSRYSAYPGFAMFVLVFAVALHSGRRRALVVYLGGAVGLSMSLLLQPAEVATASAWISTLLTVTVAWLAGENLRSRRARRQTELEEARRQVELKADEARRAVTAERLRIARDLHDVVAHSMSVVAVQAGVARHVIDQRPEVARDALGSIETTAREGLVEMRRLLGLLRSESGASDRADTAPVEGMRDLDRLLSHVRDAGLRVELSADQPGGDLPPALDVTAYRIIQEGLTNVLRHGGPVAHLAVSRTDGRLRIEVRDDGPSTGSAVAQPGSRPRWEAGSAEGSGHGLTGIRERAALFGGHVRAEPEPGDGFRLVVDLPVDPPTVSP